MFMESRQSRMNKYYDNSEEIEITRPSRIRKNQELYKEVSTLELEDFDLNSNVSVIGNNTENINLDEIKDILDKKYHERPRKKSFGDTNEIPLPKINLDETREYDINSILEKAKEEKEVNYEEDRLKKIRNTQYDILKSLDIMNDSEEIEEKPDTKPDRIVKPTNNEKTEKELMDLIGTLSSKEETSTGELDPLDILSDLRGDDESTRVMGMLALELEEAEKENNKSHIEDEDTLEIDTDSDEAEEMEESSLEEHDDTEEVKIRDVSKEDVTEELTNSFIGETTFTQSDFDDFSDLKNDMGFAKIIIKVLVAIVVLLFVAGLIVLLNKYLNLGLF